MKEEAKRLVSLVADLPEDDIIAGELLALFGRLARLWLVVGTEDGAVDVDLVGLNAESLVNLTLVGQLLAEGRDEVHCAIKHNQTVNFRVVRVLLGAEAGDCIELIQTIDDCGADRTLGKLVLDLSKDSLDALETRLNVDFVRVIVVK